jgi:hypothetical protein
MYLFMVVKNIMLISGIIGKGLLLDGFITYGIVYALDKTIYSNYALLILKGIEYRELLINEIVRTLTFKKMENSCLLGYYLLR